MKPRGKPEAPATPVTSPVTVNDRTGPNWQTTITDNAEMPLAGAPSPPELASQLGVHDIVAGMEPAGADAAISSGPNTGFTFLDSVGDRDYVSLPRINPEVDNAGGAFLVFHRNAGLLHFRSTAGVRTLVPPNEYTVVTVSGSRMLQFNVPDWAEFYKKYGVYADGHRRRKQREGTGRLVDIATQH